MKRKHNPKQISTVLSVIMCTFAIALQTANANPISPQKAAQIAKRFIEIQCGMRSTSQHLTTSTYFTAKPISEAVFKRMQGKSYKANCTIPRTELRYIQVLHYGFDGKVKSGELVCHQDIADDLIEIFQELYKAHYPIERIQLIDDYNADDEQSMLHNNTSCFNYRRVAGSKTLSYHSQGKAIDINPLYNPCVKRLRNGSTSVSPKTGRAYSNRSKTFKYKIDHNDLVYKLFKKHGFTWGGDWKSLKDYQHFEKK